MKRLLTEGIILSRTNYGEADRILSILTPDHGKLRLGARGVRKVKSKLAGGIELFSTSHITYIEGKREVGTLISTRLIKHYGNIVKDIGRVQLGYELIKLLDKATEDHPEAEYFHLLELAFAALDDPEINLELIRAWFEARLLKLAGHSPNLWSDTTGAELQAGNTYNFDPEAMTFILHKNGRFTASHIKVLRLLFSDSQPLGLVKVQGLDKLLDSVAPLVRTMLAAHIRI